MGYDTLQSPVGIFWWNTSETLSLSQETSIVPTSGRVNLIPRSVNLTLELVTLTLGQLTPLPSTNSLRNCLSEKFI